MFINGLGLSQNFGVSSVVKHPVELSTFQWLTRLHHDKATCLSQLFWFRDLNQDLGKDDRNYDDYDDPDGDGDDDGEEPLLTMRTQLASSRWWMASPKSSIPVHACRCRCRCRLGWPGGEVKVTKKKVQNIFLPLMVQGNEYPKEFWFGVLEDLSQDLGFRSIICVISHVTLQKLLTHNKIYLQKHCQAFKLFHIAQLWIV